MKTGGKDNLGVTTEWKLICLSGDASNCKITLSLSRYIKA